MATDDVIAEALLRKAYYDPKVGLLSKTKFKAKIRQLHPEIKARDVDAFLSKQALVQVNRASPFRGFFKIVAPPKHFQADIFFLSAYKRSNSNTSMFMILVDVLSRKMLIYPMKSKTQESIVAALKLFKKDVPGALGLYTDDDYSASKVVAYCEQAGMMLTSDVANDDHYDKGDKLGIVDRATRTIKTLIRNYMLANNTARFLPKLQDLVDNYNSTPHTSLKGRTPDAAYADLAFQKAEYERLTAHNDALEGSIGLEVGDYVRRRVDRARFDKEGARFSADIYVVAEQVGHKYRIMDSEQELQPRKYKYFELTKVDPAEVEGTASGTKKAAAEKQSKTVRAVQKNLETTEKEAETALRRVDMVKTRSQTRKRTARA